MAYQLDTTIRWVSSSPCQCTADPVTEAVNTRLFTPKDTSDWHELHSNSDTQAAYTLDCVNDNTPRPSSFFETSKAKAPHPRAVESKNALTKLSRQESFNRMLRRQGFVNPDNTLNKRAYKLATREKAAIRYNCIKPDGTANVSAYDLMQTKKSAIKAGHCDKNGEADTQAYAKEQFEKRVRKAGYINKDGTLNKLAYRQMLNKITARNAGFIKADGSADVNAYKNAHRIKNHE